MNHNSTAAEVVENPSLAPEKAVEPNQTVPASDSNATSNNNISLDRIEGRNIAPVSVGNDILDSSLSNTSDALQPSDSPSSMDKDATNALQKTSIPAFLKTDLAPSVNYSSRNAIPKVKDSPEDAVVSLSKMNDMLLQSLTSYHSMRPLWSKGTDQELILARSLIEEAPSVQNEPKLNQFAPLYRNFSMFRRQVMEILLATVYY
ncbi:unnamed protein product [Coffea canephora]|uniref:Uncharacterized protein n=1 Tax=Coffea canephora TaxID=49390 RepID=A0A068UIQ0_COFCA|nr:unnamed protein product [Coffea canephora]